MEIWMENGKLVEQGAWEKKIDGFRQGTGNFFSGKAECLNEIKSVFLNAMERRIPKEKFGIFLSGGVDSALLSCVAKKFSEDFICYTVGFYGGISSDVSSAKSLANVARVEWKLKELSLEETEDCFKKAVNILKPSGMTDVVSVSVAAVVIAAAELAKKDKVTISFGGLGSEEIFAGYKRHLKALNVHDECWSGLKLMWHRDLLRDFLVGSSLGISLLTPFLDEALIKAAMRVPEKFKIENGINKVVLREAAEELGVPHQIAWRKKKAAQYGSGFDKALAKLAGKNGFRYKQEYINSLGV